MTTIQIEPAAPAGLPAVLALLSASGLPHEGLAEHFDAALVARAEVEPAVQASVEFTGACPASAAELALTLASSM